jgi:hypothetical protein
MAAVFIALQFINALYDSCPNGVQVNIPNQFSKIGLFLADDGFETVLKQLAPAAMSMVKRNHITREKASHESGQWLGASSKKKVGMIGQQRPGVAFCLRLRAEILEPFNKVMTIFPAAKYSPAFYPPDHDVVQNAGSIESCCPWHDVSFISIKDDVN